MKTHYVQTTSSQALISDFKSFVFLTDSSKSSGFHIPASLLNHTIPNFNVILWKMCYTFVYGDLQEEM